MNNLEELKQFHLVLDQAPIGVQVYGTDQNLVWENARAKGLMQELKGSGKTKIDFLSLFQEMSNDFSLVERITPSHLIVSLELSNRDECRFFEVQKVENRHLLIYFSDITKQKESEKQLRISEERWQFALEGSRDGVWDWNAITNEVFFSLQWKNMLGYDSDEIENNLNEWDQRIHPEDYNAVYEVLNAHLRGETEFYEMEHRIRCKGGDYKWILDRGKVIERDSNGSPVRVIGTHADISRLKTIQEELEVTKHYQDQILGNMQEGISLLDEDLTILQVNYLIEEWFGHNRPLVGKKCYEVFYSSNTPCKNCPSLLALQTKQPQLQISPGLEGTGKWFELLSVPVRQNGDSPIRVIEFVRDVTDRQNYEVKLLAKNQELAEFAGTMFHDLRNSLDAIRGYISLLEEMGEPNTSTQGIRKHVELISSILAHSLELAREGEKALVHESIDLCKVVRQAIEITTRGKDIELSVQLPKELVIVGDSLKLFQLFKNLLENALVHGRPKIISVTSRKVEEGFVLEIMNDGVILSDENLDKIKHRRTSGLGLKIARDITESHGWFLKFDNAGMTKVSLEIAGGSFVEE